MHFKESGGKILKRERNKSVLIRVDVGIVKMSDNKTPKVWHLDCKHF